MIRQFLVVFALLISSMATAQLKIANIFGNHMVLQRNVPINVWGWAKPGQKVSISFAGKNKEAIADVAGKWKLALDKQPAGGPFTMKLKSGSEKITLDDILVGEVWIASGQSNMEWSVEQSKDAEKEMAAANYPQIRQINIPNKVGFSPQADFEKQPWVVCAPGTVAPFTAVGYFFARKLHRELKVSIGIINTTWGGTVAEAWTSKEALLTHPDFKELAKNAPVNNEDFLTAMRKINEELINKFQKPTADNNEAHWKNIDYDDSLWNTQTAPGAWEQQGLAGFDGEVWYRKTVVLEKEPATTDLVKIFLGTIDDNDETYINGTLAGKTNAWDKERIYELPNGLLHKGKNVIAVKVYDNGGDGGFYGKNPMKLIVGNDSIDLSGTWKARVWKGLEDSSPSPNNLLSSLYNAMIYPIIPYSIKGAIWYQGESNAARARQYETLFPLMINDWRNQWKQGNFPFYFVQLASFDPQHKSFEALSDWADLRYAQTKTLALPKTGMAVTTDIGNPDDIHPRNKQDVGARLALIALNKAYGKKIVSSGPMMKAVSYAANKITILFTNIGSGLVVKGSRLDGFVLQDTNGKYHQLSGNIVGNTIAIDIPQNIQPKKIQYAWADDASSANLFNKEGLPAVGFKYNLTKE